MRRSQTVPAQSLALCSLIPHLESMHRLAITSQNSLARIGKAALSLPTARRRIALLGGCVVGRWLPCHSEFQSLRFQTKQSSFCSGQPASQTCIPETSSPATTKRPFFAKRKTKEDFLPLGFPFDHAFGRRQQPAAAVRKEGFSSSAKRFFSRSCHLQRTFLHFFFIFSSFL